MKWLSNVDVYLTIILSVVVLLLGIFGVVDQGIILNALLGVMALVSFSLFQNRKNHADLTRIAKRIESSEDWVNRVFEDEYDRTELKSLLKSARKSLLLGITLSGTLPLLKDTIIEALGQGHELKVLMIKPESSSVKMTAFRNRHQSLEATESKLKGNLEMLAQIKEMDLPGTLEFKVIDYVPPYSIFAFDHDLSKGQIHVRLFPFREGDDKRPGLKLTKESGKWFVFFVEQFEKIWSAAEKPQQ